jgi:hypothetical protein
MSAYLATVPGAVPQDGPRTDQIDFGSMVSPVVFMLLVFALIFAVGNLISAVSDGIGNAVHDLLAAGGTPAPRKQFPKTQALAEPDDLFRILPDNHDEADDDSFTILPSDAPTVGVAKCFVCGRPMNDGDHSHSLM